MKTTRAIDTFVEETGGWVASQLEACTRCGICAEACHFYQATGNPDFAPVWKVELLKRAYEQEFTLGGKLRTMLHLQKKVDEADLEAWSKLVYEACTVCNKCAMVCPMGIQLGPIIHDVRAGLAEAGMVPDDLAAAVNKQIEEGSPLGVTDDVFESRLEWIADDWEIDLPVDKEGADTLVIFSSIEIMKFPDNLAHIASILNAAGENWTLSSKAREVVNFGFYEGSADHTRLLLSRVFDGAVELGVKKIVVTECGHAYDALRWTAPNLMDVPDIEITHIAAVLGEYVESGRITLKAGAYDGDGKITFHDACKIQRRGGHIEEPRKLLSILAPESFTEMTPNREQAICCGGGGGVIAIKEADPIRYKAFELKIAQAEAVGAETVVMACSNCRLQFLDGAEHFDWDMKFRGLAEMVAEAME
ncbi:MAG: (Fe-S)-binding protein [Actinobacteria bacterium]|nr:(Fe-S)-binding protein [Actinomycetota bacterium]